MSEPSEPRRTAFAMQAIGLAEMFTIHLGQERLACRPGSTSGRFHLELAAPEGESTGGGKQAVQPIKLVPERGVTIVCGSANPVEVGSELRTFDHLAQIHAQRFKGAELPFEREAYGALLKKLQAFFAMQRLPVTMLDVPRNPDGTPVVVKPAGAASRGSLIAVGLGLALAIAAAALLLAR